MLNTTPQNETIYKHTHLEDSQLNVSVFWELGDLLNTPEYLVNFVSDVFLGQSHRTAWISAASEPLRVMASTLGAALWPRRG